MVANAIRRATLTREDGYSIVAVNTTLNRAGELALEAYGVRFVISASDPGLLDRVASLAPPGSVESSTVESGERFELVAEDGGVYRVFQDTAEALACRNLELSLGVLGALVREHVALKSTHRIFIKGGVALHVGRAILVAGPPLSGRSTLVSELVRAGASYWSDEYAVLDEEGRLHPYGNPTLGGDRRDERAAGPPAPAPLGMVVVTPYYPGARWSPRVGTPGDVVLALLAHAVPARERPAETLAAVSRAAASASLIEGERGEARDAAGALLELATAAAST